jgi:DNA-binding response OmpR family regulator
MENSEQRQMNHGRILLLEDNDANRQMMSDFLIHCGYSVSSIEWGQDLFRAIATFQPNLILLDLKLPDISGFTLLQELQVHSEWSMVPVIVVSAFAFRADQQRALHLGAQDYFVKPIDLHRLLATIQAIVTFPEVRQDRRLSDSSAILEHPNNLQN